MTKLPQVLSSIIVTYRKIPKISPGAYIFQRPFLRGLFLEGIISRGAYVWREVCISKSIGLAYSWKENSYRFCFVLLIVLRAIFQVEAPGGGGGGGEGLAFIWRGDFTEGFLCYKFGGLIFGGAYKWRGLFYCIWLFQPITLKDLGLYFSKAPFEGLNYSVSTERTLCFKINWASHYS